MGCIAWLESRLGGVIPSGTTGLWGASIRAQAWREGPSITEPLVSASVGLLGGLSRYFLVVAPQYCRVLGAAF